jgi:hypothetical protein
MEFKHPKYYKELRKRNKLAESRQPVVGGQQQSDQAISEEATDGFDTSVRPDPGLKPQASSDSQVVNQIKLSSQSQASSSKPQATKSQAASDKHQA